LADAGFEVVVVDNSATFPRDDAFQVVRPGFNMGFARACNLGADQFSGRVEAIVFHNPDVEISAGGIVALQRELTQQERPGLVGPAEQVGRVVRLNGYHYPNPLREVMVASRWRLRSLPSVSSSLLTEAPASTSPRLGTGRRFASGALLMVDAAAFHAVAGFDERYFMYIEDLDLWHRVGKAGYTRSFVRDVTARHGYALGSPLAAAPRELYRWMGVELFSALNREGSWRLYRAVHRALMPMLAHQAGPIGQAISALWKEDVDPVNASERTFELMAGGSPRAK